MTPSAYNFIYSQLVHDAGDLVGLIAYGLYKRDKIEFIAKYKANHSQEPNGEAFKAFHEFSTTDGRLASYRKQAEDILATFSAEMLEEQAAEIQAEYDSQLTEELKQAHPFWQGVWQNLIAGMMSLAIVALLFVVIWSLRIGPSDVIGQIFNVDIKSKVEKIDQGSEK